MPRNEEFDWIFDYTLQFLESDKFDSAVMDFVDEKCFLFDDEEENKLIYTDIHQDFCEQIDALLTANLADVGITTELFLESCERSRSDRDINATVFERLTAMDDFQTFKKIMVKRNTELQLESLRYMTQMKQASGIKEGEGKEADFDRLESLLTPEELKALKDIELMELNKQLQDEELQDLLFQSLMEMEIIHRQEELEHAELERALMLSLAAEEERLQAMLVEQQQNTSPVASDAKATREEAPAKASAKDSAPHTEVKAAPAEAKAAPAEVKPTPSASAHSSASMAAPTPAPAPALAPTAHTHSSPKKIGALHASSGVVITNPDVFADVKPLKMKGFAPLPSIKPTSAEDDALKAAEELAEKKRQVEEVMRRANQQLAGQRRNEEELRQQVAEADPSEAERRAKHLKEQRDLLLAKKKAERDARVAAEDEKKRRAASGNPPSPDAKGTPSKSFISSLDNKGQEDSKGGPSADELAEMRRATMRMALARRMKIDLIESEEAKLAEMQESQFAEYDRKLQQVEQNREDNRKREFVLSKQLAKQQEQIARNVKLSAAALGGDV